MSSSGACRAPCPLRLVPCWDRALGRLTWAGTRRLNLPWWAVLASSTGGLSLFRGGTFFQSGGLVPWQRTGHFRLLQMSQMDRGPHWY